jgi:hypothetical protein
MDKDLITRVFKQALDIFFLNNPFNTSMGILLGFILDGILPLYIPPLKPITLITWICLGVFLLNIKALLTKHKLSPSAERVLALIKEARKAGITDLEIKQRYRLMIEKYANNVGLDQNEVKDLNKTEETEP